MDVICSSSTISNKFKDKYILNKVQDNLAKSLIASLISSTGAVYSKLKRFVIFITQLPHCQLSHKVQIAYLVYLYLSPSRMLTRLSRLEKISRYRALNFSLSRTINSAINSWTDDQRSFNNGRCTNPPAGGQPPSRFTRR